MKNLLIRSGSGILFLAVMTVCLLGGLVSYVCLMLFLLVGMLCEFYRLTLGRGNQVQKIIGTLMGVSLWALVLFVLYNSLISVFISFFVLLCLALLLFIVQLYRKNEKPFEIIAYTILGVIYVALPLSLMNVLVYGPYTLYDYDGQLLLAIFILLWSSDVGAYVFGMLLGQHGKHKLFPSISPKKSWEGFIGGLLVTVAAGWLLSYLDFGFTRFELWEVIVIALLVAVFGVFGDLIESMLKRSVGVKDSGKIMPGHGGLLDRFDAALVAFPVLASYLIVLYILR